MKACPICSSRVAKPAFGAPVENSTREEFLPQFDLALRVPPLGADSHTQEHSQYCRTEFPICRSRLPSRGHSRHQLSGDYQRIGLPVNRFNCSAKGSLLYRDRKSTRLNSSHLVISYAVFCLKKKNISRDYVYRHEIFTERTRRH